MGVYSKNWNDHCIDSQIAHLLYSDVIFYKRCGTTDMIDSGLHLSNHPLEWLNAMSSCDVHVWLVLCPQRWSQPSPRGSCVGEARQPSRGWSTLAGSSRAWVSTYAENAARTRSTRRCSRYSVNYVQTTSDKWLNVMAVKPWMYILLWVFYVYVTLHYV